MNVDPGFWHTYIDFSTTTSDQSQVGSNWLLLANRQYLPTHGVHAFHTAPPEIPELSRFLLVVPPGLATGWLMPTLCLHWHRGQGAGLMLPGLVPLGGEFQSLIMMLKTILFPLNFFVLRSAYKYSFTNFCLSLQNHYYLVNLFGCIILLQVVW